MESQKTTSSDQLILDEEASIKLKSLSYGMINLAFLLTAKRAIRKMS